jgi:hypothetical protein
VLFLIPDIKHLPIFWLVKLVRPPTSREPPRPQRVLS